MATIGKIDPTAQDANFEDVDVSQPFTGSSTALTIAPQNEVSLAGSAAAIQPMNPMESLMEVFYEMRDGINTLVSIATDQLSASRDENRDAELAESNVEPAPVAEGSDPGNEGGGVGGKFKKFAKGFGSMFTIANLIKTGVLLGLTALFTFAEKFSKQLEPVLKFIKENVWPNAVDFFMDYIDKVKTLFTDVGDKLGTIFGGDATIMERVTALVGIFTDFGKFILGIGDSLVTNVLEMFGVNFDPYDSAGAWVLGKLNEMWTGITTFFTDAGTFVVEGFTGAYDFVSKKIMSAFTTVGDWFSATGEFLLDGATGLFDWVKGKVAVPIGFLKDLFSFPESPKDFATKFLDIVLLPYNLAINFFRGIFGFGEDEQGNVEPFSLGDFIIDTVKKGIDFIKGMFTFDIKSLLPSLPNVGDAFMNMVGGMLPSPDSWIGKGLYALPGTDTLKLAAESFAAGGTFSDGKLTMPEAVASGVVEGAPDEEVDDGTVKSMDQVRKEEIAANEAEMARLDKLDPDANVAVNGYNSAEAKLFELEMRNEELKMLLMENAVNKEGGTTIINAPTTNQGDQVTQDTHNYQDLSVDHSDPVAAALAARGYD